MKNSDKKILFSFMLLIFFSAGCAGPTNSLDIDYSGLKQLSDPGNLEIKVICPDKQDEEHSANISQAVVCKLKELDVFKDVYGVESAFNRTSDLRLEITVTALKPVSKSARFWLGSMAGQGRIESRIDLLDLRQNKQILWAEVGGATSTGTILAGTTEEAIDQLAQAVAKIFQGKISKSKPLEQETLPLPSDGLYQRPG